VPSNLSVLKLPDAESPEEAIDLKQFPETPIEGDEDLFFSPPNSTFVKKVGEVKPAAEVVSRDAVASEISTIDVHPPPKEASPASDLQQHPTVEASESERSDASGREASQAQDEAIQNPSAPSRPVQLQPSPAPNAAGLVQGAPPSRTPPAPPPLLSVPSDLPQGDTESQPTSPSRPTAAVRRIIVVSPKATVTPGRPLPPAPNVEIAALNEAEEESAC
jgi:hypothetical protein